MNRPITLLVVALTVLAMVGAPAAVMAQNGTDNTDNGDGPEEPDIQPGEQLSGVIGVQDAEFAGELEERSFGIAVANAATENAQAEVVSERLTAVDERLHELENRTAELEDARESGNITEGQYRAEMAKIAAEKGTIDRVANQSGAVASELPDDVLESNGINVTAIDELRDRAHELGGPAVAEIARSIAGPDVGQPVGTPAQDRIPTDAGPGTSPIDPGNASETNPGQSTDGDHNDTDTDNGSSQDGSAADESTAGDASTDESDFGASPN